MSVGSAGAGANKQIRYSVIIDTALAESKLRTLGINLKTTFESATPSVSRLGTGIQDVGNKMATTSTKSNTFTGALKTFDTTTKSTSGSVSILSSDFDKLATGGLTKTNTLAGKTTGSFDKLEKQTGKTTGTMSKLREGFAGNRGLIYSMGTIFGTMTGVVAELQLMDDAHAQVAEATEKLTRLEAAGQKGTQAYTQAMQQKEKAERFASFTTRNLALATANFVPELLLLATNLSKADGIGGKLAGTFGKLKSVFGFSTAATAAGGALTTLGVGGTAAGVGMEAGAVGARSLSAALATIAVPLIAVTGGILLGYHILDQSAKVFPAFATQGIKLTTAVEDINLHFAELDKVMEVTGKGRDQILEFPEEAAKAYLAMGGKVDSSGKIVVDTTKMMEEGSKTGFQQIGEAVQKATGIWDLFNPAVSHAGEGVDGLGKTVKNSINPVMRYKEVWDDTLGTTKLVPNGFKDTYVAVNGVTTAINASTTEVIKNNGMWIDFGSILHEKVIPAITNTDKVLVDHGEAITKGAQAQYDYDQQITTSIQGWTKYQESLVTFDQELNNSSGTFAKAGDVLIKYGDTVNKTGFEYIDLGNAAKLEAMSEEERNATIEEAIRINDEYNKSFQEGLDMMKKRNEEIRDSINTEKILNTIGINRNDIMSSNIDVVEKLRDVVKGQNVAYQDEEFRLAALLLKYGKLTPQLAKLTLNTQDNTAELGNAAAGLEDLDKGAGEATDSVKDLAKAQADAAKKAQEMADNIGSGLEKISAAFESVDKTAKFQKIFDKAKENFDDFLRDVGKKLGDLGPAGIIAATNFIKEFEAKGTKGMNTATKNLFQPVFTWIEQHKDEPPDKFIQGFLDFIGKTDQKVQDAFSQILPKPEEVKVEGNTIGTAAGEGVAEGFRKALDKHLFPQEGTLLGPLVSQQGGFPKPGEDTNGDKKDKGQMITITANNKPALDAMTAVQEYWKRIGGNIQGLVPILKTDNKQANDVILAVQEYWKRIGGNIQGLVPVLKVNNKTAIDAINQVYSQWKRIVGDIAGLVAKPKVDPKPAKNSLDEIYKYAKRIVGDINGLTGTIKVKYDVEKKPAGLTHANLSDINSHANAHASNNGMLNVTIVNEDEFGQKKLKRFRSQLGKESFRFG